MTRNDRRVAIITGGSQGIGAGLVPGTAGAAGRWWSTPVSGLTRPAKLLGYFPYLAPPPGS